MGTTGGNGNVIKNSFIFMVDYTKPGMRKRLFEQIKAGSNSGTYYQDNGLHVCTIIS